MSVMSDRWIRRQCSPVTALGIKENDGRVYQTVQLVDDAVAGLVERESGNTAILFCDDSASMNYMRGFDRIQHLDAETTAQYSRMIQPFELSQVKVKTDPFPSSTGEDDSPRKVISYGTSSYGYDLRCSSRFKIFTNVNSTIVDPKNFDPKSFVDFEGDCCIIPPNSFALASSVEYLCIPRNILTICLGKSTYARCGIVVNVTPLEPEWEGHVTLEFSNTTPLPAKIYANEGVAQVIFLNSDEGCETSYKDREGKYMFQSNEPVSPKA